MAPLVQIPNSSPADPNVSKVIRLRFHFNFIEFPAFPGSVDVEDGFFLIARLARSDPRNRFSVPKNFLSIYSILVYFTMFSFRVLM